MKALIASDESVTVRGISAALQLAGFEVDVVRTLTPLVDRLRHSEPGPLVFVIDLDRVPVLELGAPQLTALIEAGTARNQTVLVLTSVVPQTMAEGLFYWAKPCTKQDIQSAFSRLSTPPSHLRFGRFEQAETPSLPAAPTPIDWRVISELIGESDSDQRGLIVDYLELGLDAHLAFAAALGVVDLNTIARATHRLSGGLGSVGALHAAALAQRVNVAARARDFELVMSLGASLLSELSRVEQTLREALELPLGPTKRAAS